jgi:O-antigen/teichoic acid export membrane protein
VKTDPRSEETPPLEAKEPLVTVVRGTKAGLLVLVGIGALNVGNAVFHLLSARLLGPSQYGEVVSLVAAQGLIALPFGGIQYAVARFVAEDAARNDADAVGAFVRRMLVGSLLVASVVTIVVTALSPLVRTALGVEKLTPVVLTALFMLPALLAPPIWGVAQGLQRFGLISASMITGVTSRILLILLLIPVGLGVGGVMGATLVAGFIALLAPLPFVWSWARRRGPRDLGPANGVVLRYTAPVVAGTLAITSLTTVDVIAAKVALSSHDAGIYGSASFIGRLLLYLPMTVATVLLPKVTSRAAVERDTTEILHASLAVTAVFSLAGTALLVAVPRLVVDITFGSKYDGAIPLIGLFGLAMTVYALLNVLLAYHLGHGRTGMAWLLLGGAAAQVVLYIIVHGSTYQLVGANLLAAVGLLVIHELFFERTLGGGVSWLVAFVRQRVRGWNRAVS